MTWKALADATGSVKLRALVSKTAVSGTTLSVTGNVTDSSGATSGTAGTTAVR